MPLSSFFDSSTVYKKPATTTGIRDIESTWEYITDDKYLGKNILNINGIRTM